MRPIVPLVIVGVAAFFLLRRDAQAASGSARSTGYVPPYTPPSEQRERTTRSGGSQLATASQPDPVLRSVQGILTRYHTTICPSGGALGPALCAPPLILADGIWGPVTARALRAVAQDAINASLDTRVCTVISAQRSIFGGNRSSVSANLEEFGGLLWRLTDREAWLASDRDLIENLLARFANTARATWDGPPAGSFAAEIRRLRGLSR